MSELDPARARTARQVIWLALLASQLVYFGLLLGGVRPEGDAPTLPSFFPGVLAGVAAINGAGAHFLWRRASGAGRPLHARQRTPSDSFPFYLIAWVLDESVGLFGLVLGFLGFAPTTWLGFSIAGFLFLLVHRPRAD